MKQKELKRLSRSELLELLLAQTKETEQLQKQLEEAREALNCRQLKMWEAGDLAHAVLAVNNVMESAQQAADQYIESIAAMKAETQKQCRELIRKAQEEAERIKAGEVSNQVFDDENYEFSQLGGIGAGTETGTV